MATGAHGGPAKRAMHLARRPRKPRKCTSRGPRKVESLALAPMPKASDAAPESTVQLAARLARNAVDCLPSDGLSAKLWEAESQGRKLRVKLGERGNRGFLPC